MSDSERESYRIGQVVRARAEQVLQFGVFARLRDGTLAYIRQRELCQSGNVDPQEIVSVGQEITAMVIGLPGPGQNLELSVRRTEPNPWDAFGATHRAGDSVVGRVKNLAAGGVFVELVPGVDGFVPLSELAPWPVAQPEELLWVHDQVEAIITHLEAKNRRLLLSIRQQMGHIARVQQIVGRLQGEVIEAQSEPEAPVVDVPATSQVDLAPLGWVMVVDDDRAVREQLVIWLGLHGCQAEGAATLDEATQLLSRGHLGTALVDLELGGEDGLAFVQAVQATKPHVPLIVMSIPEWIARKSPELEQLRLAGVLPKPLILEDVLETLGRLARGEPVQAYRVHAAPPADETTDALLKAAKSMRVASSLESRLERALEDCVRFTRAEEAVLFQLDSISQAVQIAAQAGRLPLNHAAVYALSASPVRSLILEGGEVFETSLTDQSRRRYQKLLDVVPFDSCVGVAVPAAGSMQHALFLFHREPNAFTRYRLRDAHATAALLGVALESHALEKQLRSIGPFLLTGELAAGFGHDVSNKMSALELQVRNLQGLCETGRHDPDAPRGSESGEPVQIKAELNQLLETTLNLKQTAGAFRELIKADAESEIDVNQAIRRACLLLRPTAQRLRVRIELNLSSDLPPVTCSAVRLEQVFMNAMLNAVQQMAAKLGRWQRAEARLTVTTGSDPGAARPVWVRFSDTGPGIHRRLWEQIFELGFSTRPDGTGMGLYVARSLIESMGGAIQVEESHIPLGTTFRVELPAAAADR